MEKVEKYIEVEGDDEGLMMLEIVNEVNDVV